MKYLFLLTTLSLSLYGQSAGTVTHQVLGVPAYYCADAGSTDAYACSITPPLDAYRVGTHYTFRANTANTGAATLNLNGLGAIAIQTANGSGLATGDIVAGQMVDVVYKSGPVMQIQGTLGSGVVPLNVLSYGATADGTTDDSAAINAAIAAAKVQKRSLYIPGGTYAVGSLIDFTQADYIHIYGDGSGATVFKWIGVSGGMVVQYKSTQQGMLGNLSIDGNSLAGVGLSITADNLIQACYRNSLYNIRVHGVTQSPAQDIYIGSATDQNVSAMELSNVLLGNGSTNGVYIEGTQTVNIAFRNLRATGVPPTANLLNMRAGIVTVDGMELSGSGTIPVAYRVTPDVVYFRATNSYAETNSPLLLAESDASTGGTYVLSGTRVLWSGVGGRIIDVEHGSTVRLDSFRIDSSVNGSLYVHPLATSVLLSESLISFNEYSGASLTRDYDNVTSDLMEPSTAAKPTCTVALRGNIYIEKGATTVSDQSYVCSKMTDDSYAWLGLFSMSRPGQYLMGTGAVATSNVYSLEIAGSVRQLMLSDGAASNPKQLQIEYNVAGDYGRIQAIQQGVGYFPLQINPSGGGVEVGGGLKLYTAVQPSCGSANRGQFWYTAGGAGVKDDIAVCGKDAANAYAWRVIY